MEIEVFIAFFLFFMTDRKVICKNGKSSALRAIIIFFGQQSIYHLINHNLKASRIWAVKLLNENWANILWNVFKTTAYLCPKNIATCLFLDGVIRNILRGSG